MIIVVEGCDNSGKTTLALALAKHLKAIFLKTERVPPFADDLFAYHRILEKAVQYGEHRVVSDRHAAISDPIYGPIIRGHTRLREDDVNRCIEEMDVIVYCRPPDKMIIGNMPERQQMHGVIQNVADLIRAYDEFFANDPRLARKRVFTYDWTRDSSVQLFEEIKRLA